jgi:hypothetical protein
MARVTVSGAVKHVQKHGVLLLFPINNRPEPLSLWHCFFADDEMRWEWSDDGDNRIALIWHLRAPLSQRDDVVYTKWFQGRATCLSIESFRSLAAYVAPIPVDRLGLSSEARDVLEILEADSPLPTKRLRIDAGLDGKEQQRVFESVMKELWSRLLIVGSGEVEEGGFPSLAVGASRLLYEDAWQEACELSSEERDAQSQRIFGVNRSLSGCLDRFRQRVSGTPVR